MSTAILHAGPYHDFGDILKNQSNGMMTNEIFQSAPSLQQNIQGQQTQLTQLHHLNFAAAFVAAQQQQQQHQNQERQQQILHNALTRAVSNPASGVAVNNLFTSLNEIINVGAANGNINGGHRKLERTQSEPLPQVNTSRYKTELCRPFEEAGECKYGDKCQFAHGFHELRNLQRHPKYKTELCRTFHSVGFCPYGPRCHFVHNAEEARNHNRNVAAYHARLAQQQLLAQQKRNGHHLPLSPALSMSTSSDRSSPVGSLSPTTSMGSFFPDQSSPTFPHLFAFPHSPPASPVEDLSPNATPPPTLVNNNQQQGNAMSQDERLPVFNRMSSALDAFHNLAI